MTFLFLKFDYGSFVGQRFEGLRPGLSAGWAAYMAARFIKWGIAYSTRSNVYIDEEYATGELASSER